MNIYYVFMKVFSGNCFILTLNTTGIYKFYKKLLGKTTTTIIHKVNRLNATFTLYGYYNSLHFFIL